jgi:hypothetical protein
MLFHIAVNQICFSFSTFFFILYCKVYHYQITLESGSEYAQTRGKVSVKLIGTLQTVIVIFDEYV